MANKRLSRGPDGVMLGAEPLMLLAGARAVLVIHGFGDTPQSVGDLARYLHKHGWTVRVPLLPGHGRTLKEFAKAKASDWLAAVRAEYATLRKEYNSVAVIGQSMGGALATIFAAENPAVPALVLLAPYITLLPKVARIARLRGMVSLFTPYIRGRSEASIWDPSERAKSLGFGVTPTMLLGDLAVVANSAWRATASVSTPTLILQSRHDNRIRLKDAERVFARFGSSIKEFSPLDGCGHVIAVDYCRAEVFARCDGWLRRFDALDDADSRRST